jgi:hypothetical protein
VTSLESNVNKIVGIVFGVVFIAVGLLGFLMNPTLIVFGVNGLHNLVHLASGGVLLAGAFMNEGRNARQVNLAFGVVYLVVAALGFIAPGLANPLLASDHDAFPFADAGLHAILGIALVGAALAFKSPTTGTIAARRT